MNCLPHSLDIIWYDRKHGSLHSWVQITDKSTHPNPNLCILIKISVFTFCMNICWFPSWWMLEVHLNLAILSREGTSCSYSRRNIYSHMSNESWNSDTWYYHITPADSVGFHLSKSCYIWIFQFFPRTDISSNKPTCTLEL